MVTSRASTGNPPGGKDCEARAQGAADAAGARAGVRMSEAETMDEFRSASALMESVWGRTGEGVPMNSEVLLQLTHAGGAVALAREAHGRLVGTAVLAVSAPAGSTYSMIAATDPGSTDRGIGRAMKLRQRAWALNHGYRSTSWTFDPLVSRNARFNLVTLGAEAIEYVPSFYGQMNDDLNGEDDSDRLVVHWQLDCDRARAAAEGARRDPDGPEETSTELEKGPDGATMLRRDGKGLWCRIPPDVVALRRTHPGQASQWRSAVRDVMTAAFDDGLVITHLSRRSWYLLTERANP